MSQTPRTRPTIRRVPTGGDPATSMTGPPAERGDYTEERAEPRPRSADYGDYGDYADERAYRPQRMQPRRDSFPIVLAGMLGALVVGVMIVAYLIASNSNKSNTSPGTGPVSQGVPTLAPAAASSPAGSSGGKDVATATATGPDNRLGTVLPSEGQVHVKESTPITYQSYPPSSGTHYGKTADYGFKDLEAPEGQLVHNLEHGAIVIYYKPGTQVDVLQELRDVYANFPPAKYGKVKMVITPYSNPKMQTPIEIASWTRVQPFASFDRDGLLKFYQANVDKGPEDVP